MAPHKITPELDDQETNVDLPTLEVLLRQSLDDNTWQIFDYKAITLLPPGENYCGIIVKLDVIVRRDGSEKVLQLVAKTPTTTEHNNVDWPSLFEKELFVYKEMRLLYRELENESGISQQELINVWPGYVGYENSLDGGDDIDENSVLLMENIKTQNFYVMDRKKGLDVHHAGKALALLARYHALSIVMQQRRPSFAKKAIDQAQVIRLDLALSDEGYDSVLKAILKIPCLQKHLDIVKASFERARDGNLFKTVPSETWTSITHGDFWVNNMLFRKDSEAIDMLPICLLATKIFVHEVDRDCDDKGRKLINTIFEAETSDLFAEKLKGFTEMYEKVGWF